jgi:hypothetical protein
VLKVVSRNALPPVGGWEVSDAHRGRPVVACRGHGRGTHQRGVTTPGGGEGGRGGSALGRGKRGVWGCGEGGHTTHVHMYVHPH